MIDSAPLDIFTRVWTPKEILSGADAIGRLREVPTVFQTRQQRSELPAHGGPFSIKMVRAGHSCYRFGRRSYGVRPGDMLMVAAGDHYSTHIDDEADIVTIYLPDQYIAGAAIAVDDPTVQTSTPAMRPEFAPHLRRDDLGFRLAVERLAKTRDVERYEERLVLVAGVAAGMVGAATAATRRIGAAKPGTRRELFGRVSVARYRLEEAPATPVTLQELAKHSALSPFHFLRTFIAAFGETPAQMRRRLCLDRASAMLAKQDLAIGEIAFRAGFDSQSAFSRAFHRRTGLTPSSFRQVA